LANNEAIWNDDPSLVNSAAAKLLVMTVGENGPNDITEGKAGRKQEEGDS
jgi:hypothetical protein